MMSMLNIAMMCMLNTAFVLLAIAVLSFMRYRAARLPPARRRR